MHVSHLKAMDWRNKWWRWSVSVCWKMHLSYYSHDWALSSCYVFIPQGTK